MIAHDLSVVPRTDNLGRTVVDGNIRFLSVSQIKRFWPETDGCPRAWAFEKVFGKKVEKTVALATGSEKGLELEHYLKTGVDALSPIVRVGKHLLPAPGPDLEVEVELGNRVEAAKLRDEYLRTTSYEDRARLAEAMKIIGGLTANDIPLIGAADFRHRRGEFVDPNGKVQKELPGYRVAEVGDHKTSSRINDYVSRTGTIYPGYAKTVDQILSDVQMNGYAVNTYIRYPDTTHVRLSHIYYQTKNGYHAEKRTGLIAVENAVRWWETNVEPVAREMEDVARVKSPDEAPVNLRACRAFNRDCDHAPYCNRPEGTVRDLFQIRKGDEMTQGLFGQMQGSAPAPQNGVHQPPAPSASQGLFGQMGAVAAPPPAMSDAERQRLIDAEKARLLGQDEVAAAKALFQADTIRLDVGSGQIYDKRGAQAGGWIMRAATAAERTAFEQLKAPSPAVVPPPPMFAAVPPPPAPQHVGSINPPDRPALDPIAAATPLSPDAIATITDPQIRTIAENHAAAAAAQAAAAAVANPTAEKTSGRCPAGGEKMALTPAQAGTKKVNCPRCGKELRLKTGDIAEDFSSGTLPGHIMQKAPVTSAIAAPPPPPVQPALAQTSTAAAPPPPATTITPPAPPPPPVAQTASVPGIKISIEQDDGTMRQVTQEEMDKWAASSSTAPTIPAPRASIDHDLRKLLQNIVDQLQAVLK